MKFNSVINDPGQLMFRKAQKPVDTRSCLVIGGDLLSIESTDGKTAACPHLSILGNIAAACTDL